jgi:hypothetical protein
MGGREHDRPGVAAFDHDPAPGAQSALQLEQCRAHLGVRRDLRRALRDIGRANRGGDVLATDVDVVLVTDEFEANVEVARDLSACGRIRPFDAARLRRVRDGSIDRAGVEEPIAELTCEQLRDR